MIDVGDFKKKEFPDWLKPIAEKLAAHLKQHRIDGKSSAEKPVTSTRILEAYNKEYADYFKQLNERGLTRTKALTDSHIRQMRVYLLEQGHPIYSLDNGYWYGDSMDDANKCYSFLKNRRDMIDYTMELVMKNAKKKFQEQINFNNN